MRVLLTGGAGFIGSYVAESLTTAGHELRIFDNLHPAAHSGVGWPAYLQGLSLVRGDLRDAWSVKAALDGIEAVVHQAAMVGLGVDARDMPEYVSCNDLGTAILLAEMARRDIGRLVFASSMVVYGEGRYSCPAHGVVRPGPRAEADLKAGRYEPRCPSCGAAVTPGPVPEDAPLDPRNTYAASKVATEHLAASWVRLTGGTAIGLRYHNVYGPRMPRDTPYAGVAAIFRSALEAGRAPRVLEDGHQRRDFVHVRDVARANVLALLVPEPVPGAYNVASGQPHTVGELAVALSGAMGGPAPEVVGGWRPGDVRHVFASPALAAARLGFRAEVGFAAGSAELATAQLRAPAGAGT